MDPTTGYIPRGALFPLLRRLCKRKQTGVLKIENPSGTWEAGLHHGRLSALSLPSAYTDPLLGELLLKNGVIAPKDLQSSLREAREQGSLYGQVLVAHGLSSEALWEALKAQTQERFSRLLRHGWGSFAFQQGHRLQAEKGLGRPLDPLLEMKHKGPAFFEQPRFFRSSKTSVNGDCLETPGVRPSPKAQKASKRAAQGSSKKKRHPQRLGPTPQGDINEEFQKNLKRWWRSMAKKYHPDSHANADAQTRILLTQRFMEAQETYRLCLESGVLPAAR